MLTIEEAWATHDYLVKMCCGTGARDELRDAARELALAAANSRGAEGECVACGSIGDDPHIKGCEVVVQIARIEVLGRDDG